MTQVHETRLEPDAARRFALAPLLRVARGHALRRPLQSGLMILGIALGVAVVVAVDLANRSALAAFELSTEAITGRASHRLVGGPAGLDAAAYRRLRLDGHQRDAAPVVEGLVRMPDLGGASFTLMGVDPLAEPPFRDLMGSQGQGLPETLLAEMLLRPGAVLIGSEVAAQAGLAVGDRLVLEVGGRPAEAWVAALLEPGDGPSRRALETLILTDIASAQELLGRRDRLDRIDLRLPQAPADLAARLAELEPFLPPGAEIQAAGDQQATVASMTEAFRLNLTALSLLALLVGMFLIFNTVRFSVVQRRATLATLRSLGATRAEIFAMILVEAGLLGALGSVLGVGLGILLGRGAVSLVTQTINDLYFVVNVRGVRLDPLPLARGGLAGLTAALVAASLPALEATSVPPITALRRSSAEASALAALPRLTFGGLACALLGVGLLALPGQRVDLGFLGMAAIIFAFALLVPVLTLGLMRLALPVTGRLFGLVGRMAPRDVGRALSRTAVAIAALMVAVCVSIGVSVMVGSFRQTVQLWLGDTLRADVYISPPAETATRVSGTQDPALARRLAGLPGVTGMSTVHRVSLRSPELGPVDVAVLLSDIAGANRPYLEAEGDAEAVWRRLEAGAVAVSEPFARRTGLGLGDVLRLGTEAGPRDFPIAGVFYDYGSERGLVFMADPVYRAGWSDDRISSIALFLAPEVDADAFAVDLRRQLAAGPPLNIRSNRGLRAEVLAVFDRAFAITSALQLLAIVVAFVGVLSALMALQLERARDYGTLRATGMTEGQLGGLVLLETGLIGATAGLMSWPAGLSLALLLIYVINRRSFGWTIQPAIGPGIFLAALALAIGAALLAGLYPALRLRRLPIARVLREE